MGIFERYLTVWVAMSIILGAGLGISFPEAFLAIAKVEYAHVNLIVALLIWVMIYPMMVQVDFQSIKSIHSNPQGLYLTLSINWLVKPFTMPASPTSFSISSTQILLNYHKLTNTLRE